MNKIRIENGKGKSLLIFDEDTEEFIEDDIYCEEAIENYNENDEISAEEEGFMRGYLAS